MSDEGRGDFYRSALDLALSPKTGPDPEKVVDLQIVRGRAEPSSDGAYTISPGLAAREISNLARDEFGEVEPGAAADMCRRLAQRFGGSPSYAARRILEAPKPGSWWPSVHRDLEEVARGR